MMQLPINEFVTELILDQQLLSLYKKVIEKIKTKRTI